MSAKYMGSKPTTQTATFTISELGRTFELRSSVLSERRIQVHPLLSAISFLRTYDDTDVVRIPLEENAEEGWKFGFEVVETTENEMHIELLHLLVRRDSLTLVLRDDEEVEYVLPHEAYSQDLLAFISLYDQTLLNPIPDQLNISQQSYVDSLGNKWDQTDDPFRFHTKAMTEGDDFCGWLENELGTQYAYVDYQRDRSMQPDADEVEMLDAGIFLQVYRDEEDDSVVTLVPYDVNNFGSGELEDLVLTRSI